MLATSLHSFIPSDGRRCEIINLNQRKDVVGQTCIVKKYIGKKNRYKVTTEHTGETFLVGRENLKRRDRTPEDPGCYITFEDGDYKRHTFASNEDCQEFVRNWRVLEHEVSQNQMQDFVVKALHGNDAQTVLDWLGSPIDEDKLTSVRYGASMLHFTVLKEHKELTSLLLQYGAPIDIHGGNGVTPILYALGGKSRGFLNETVSMLYEWGASLEHKVSGVARENMDELLATTPMFENELVKRRCEIISLNQRKDLIGQTCIVEDYIAKKDRYTVTTEHVRETFHIRRDNLKRRDRTPDDPGYYITFEDGEYKRHTFASNEECQEFVREIRELSKSQTKI